MLDGTLRSLFWHQGGRVMYKGGTIGEGSGWGVEEVETSLPLGSCPTEIDKGTTCRGGATGVTNSLGLSPNLDGTGRGVTTTTPVRGARGIFISISLGLGPDFGDTGGVQPTNLRGGQEVR